MDIPMFIAAFILAFIAAAEIILLIRCPKAEPFPMTILICTDSADIESRLRYAAYLLSDKESHVEKVILLEKNSRVCSNADISRFLAKYQGQAILVSEKNENFLQKIIDFTEEI